MKNETYFEFDQDLNEGFTTIPNYILNDTRLTYKAVGVYVQILQYRNTGKHKVYLKSLSGYRSDKRTAVSTAIKELEEYGYISKYYIRNDKGQMNGMKYIVRMKPIVEHVGNTTCKPKAENLNSDKPNSDSTPLKIKYNKNKINKKENIDDEEVTPEQQLIALYKSFKLEKRVMPHTLKLLKDNVHISLDVFEQLFINATSKDSTYRYLQEVLKDLNTNDITTLEEFNKHLDDRKGKGTKGSNKEKSKTNNNKFKNFTETFTNYSENELDKIINKSQKEKFEKDSNINVSIEDKSNNNDFEKIMYEKCINSNWNCVDTTKKYAIEYAKKNGLYYPENVKF